MVPTNSIQDLIDALETLKRGFGDDPSLFDEAACLKRIVKLVKPRLRYLDKPIPNWIGPFRAVRLCDPGAGWGGIYLSRKGNLYEWYARSLQGSQLTCQEAIDKHGFNVLVSGLVKAIKDKAEQVRESQAALLEVVEEMQALVTPTSSQ